MKMFVAALGALLAAASASAIAQPAPGEKVAVRVVGPTAVNPASLALAHQILTIGLPPEQRSQMFMSVLNSIVDQQRKNMESMAITKDKDLQAIVDRSVQRMWREMMTITNAALPDIFESMARAYARSFSPDDLQAILDFVKTPAGQHFFQRAPLILKDPDVQAANQRVMAQLMRKMPELIRQTKQDIDDYVGKKAKEDKPAAPEPVS